MVISGQRLYILFGSVTPRQVYAGETVSVSSVISLSGDVNKAHTLPISYIISTLSLGQSVSESGIIHDTTPEENVIDDLDFVQAFNFMITYSLSDTLDLGSLGGLGYSETLTSALVISQTVEEGYVYSPSELNLGQSAVSECGPGISETLVLSQTVGLTFSKTDNITSNISFANYGVAVLLRDGHEYTYDIKGSGDA